MRHAVHWGPKMQVTHALPKVISYLVSAGEDEISGEAPEEFELYDLQADPGELTNLYGDPRHAKLVDQLKDRMTQLQAETG
jgi:arylsulfatase A-like enzyme